MCYSIFQWQKEQKLNVALQQKKLLSLEKETQLQKKVLKVKRNVRIYFPFLFKLTFDVSCKLKLIKKERSKTDLF